MKKVLSALLLSVCVALTIVGAVDAQVKGTSFDSAIAITELEHAFELKLASSGDEDNRFYHFVPSETATYVVTTQPSSQEVYVSMYSSDNLMYPTDGRSVWDENINDFGIAHELEAGKGYYFKVGAYYGPATGTITISRYEGTIAEPYYGDAMGEVVLDKGEFDKASTLSPDVLHNWSIKNDLYESDGELVFDTDDCVPFTLAPTRLPSGCSSSNKIHAPVSISPTPTSVKA